MRPRANVLRCSPAQTGKVDTVQQQWNVVMHQLSNVLKLLLFLSVRLFCDNSTCLLPTHLYLMNKLAYHLHNIMRREVESLSTIAKNDLDSFSDWCVIKARSVASSSSTSWICLANKLEYHLHIIIRRETGRESSKAKTCCAICVQSFCSEF